MREKGEEEGLLAMEVGWRWKERKRMGSSLGGDGLGREGEEEDLEGVIPQGPSVNSIGFWFPSQRNLFFAKSEKLFEAMKKSL